MLRDYEIENYNVVVWCIIFSFENAHSICRSISFKDLYRYQSERIKLKTMTQLLYVSILIVALGFAYLAQKRNKKSYLFLIVAVLTIMAGFRGVSCGVDTPLYYDNIVKSFPYSWQFREEGFRLIANYFIDNFQNPQLVFIFCAFITNLLILLRLWDFKDKANFGFMTLLYLLMYFSNSMNIMRQYVAVAIVFYGTRYLNKNKLLFIPFVIAAFFIHRSSLLALGYFVISLWAGFTNKQKKIFVLPLALSMLGAIGYVANYLASDIASYRAQSVQNLNITYFYILFITILAYVLQKKNVYVRISEKTMIPHYDKYSIDRDILYYVFIGLSFSCLSMFFAFVGRTGLYYSIFDIVFWGIACKKFKNTRFNKFLILVYTFYIFGLVIFRNDCLLFPYSIFFY